MNRLSNISRIWAIVLCITILSARMAVAAYACPTDFFVAKAPAAHMDCCDESNSDRNPLCLQACSDDPQKHELGWAIPVAPAPVAVARLAPSDAVVSETSPRDPALARVVAPPIVLLSSRIRR
jgi:hypothetical protein